MSNHTASPTTQHRAELRPPADLPRAAVDRSIRTASTAAGVALLLMSAVAIFGNVIAVDGLVSDTSPAQTVSNIKASLGLFRLGIVSLVLVVALDVVVAWALYRVFSPVSTSLSMLAAVLRLVYSAVFMVAIAQLLGVVRLLSTDTFLTAFGTDQLTAQAMINITAFNDIWYVGQFLFGLHLLLIGYLAYRSHYIPRLLAVLLAVSGLGYATDSLGAVLSPGAWTDISSFTFLGEFLLALWLVIRARSIATTASAIEHHASTSTR